LGHLKDNIVNLNYQQLVAPNQTIVIYMGLTGLDNICASFIQYGAKFFLHHGALSQGFQGKRGGHRRQHRPVALNVRHEK
jgi:hypothetical protein